jgi:hypothetical protein
MVNGMVPEMLHAAEREEDVTVSGSFYAQQATVSWNTVDTDTRPRKTEKNRFQTKVKAEF